MNSFVYYLFQATCWQIVFWLLYILFLKKETYFKLNRFYLITGLVSSISLPLFPFSYKVYAEAATIDNTPFVQLSAQASSFIPAFQNEQAFNIPYFTIIYFMGFIWFLYRIVSSFLTFLKITTSAEYTWCKSTKVVLTKWPITPCSFFSKIILPQKQYSDDEINSILEHEKIHIQEYHSIDIIIAEIIRAFTWVNPICYFYVKSIKENHEFLADRGAINSGLKITTYKTVLANQFLNYKTVSQFNSFFNFNSLKRIKMMTKVKSSPIKRIKFLIVLPVFGLLSLAFAEPDYIIPKVTNLHMENTDSIDSFFVSGWVYDMKNGKPISKASVSILDSSERLSTDENGKFYINAAKGDQLSVSHTGFLKEVFEVQEGVNYVVRFGGEESKKESQRIFGDKVYQVKGKIIDKNEQPIAGVKIECNTVKNHPTNDNVLTIKNNSSTISDKNGKFIMNMKQGDNYNLPDYGCSGFRKNFEVGHWGSFSGKNEDGSSKWKISILCEEVVKL